MMPCTKSALDVSFSRVHEGSDMRCFFFLHMYALSLFHSFGFNLLARVVCLLRRVMGSITGFQTSITFLFLVVFKSLKKFRLSFYPQRK